MGPGPAIDRSASCRQADRQRRVRALICDHTAFVTRILRGGGVAQSDVADEVQRTFISAARRIDDIRPGAERGFLFSVATKVAAHARRAYARRPEILSGVVPESVEVRRGPEEVAAQRQMAALFARILDSIDEPLREVFVLQAIERVGTRETAATLRIPPGTVASRMRRARSQLQARIAILRRGR